VSGPVVVLDACVLVPIRLATTLLWLAETGLFQPLWSEPILDEVQRNLPKVGVTPEQASRRVGMMREAFGAEALIDGFENLIEQMRCDPKDRHILAAAVRGGADTVVCTKRRTSPPIRHPARAGCGSDRSQPSAAASTPTGPRSG
jgi:predicted nucleic acid-binding protein